MKYARDFECKMSNFVKIAKGKKMLFFNAFVI